jgi:lysozyme family protein
LDVPLPAAWTVANDFRWGAVRRRLFVTEGGYVNDAADRGGATKYGISLRFLKAVGALDANHDGFADLDLNFDTVLDGHDIKALTPEIAGKLYLRHFYLGPGFWNLPQPFDAALFDQAVNGGTTASIKLLQRALTRMPGFKLNIDGQLGPITRHYLTEALRLHYEVLFAYRSEAKARYRAIVAADPSQQKYIKGWIRRAQELGNV